MREAVLAVKRKEMGLLKASKTFNVPRSTIKDYVKKTEEELEKLLEVPLGRKPVLPSEIEDELVEYCLQMEVSFYGLTARDVKRMAFHLAMRNNIPHPFSNEKKSAGRKWLRLFFKRHPALSLRKPQPLSLARIRGFSRENVKKFFDILKPELELVKFSPTRVFNVDETGVTSVQHKSMRVVSLKGRREVHKLSSAERGRLVTIVACMSASGNFVPPMLVFPRKRMKPELMDGAPPGSISGCHVSGWIQTDLFTKWFAHFISYVKPTKDDPVVLILDGHMTHTRNLDVIDLARENGVSLVCLPPHCSDRMQPLDKTFMKSFKTFYAQEIETWLVNHPFRPVTVFQIGDLVGKAYEKTATPAIASKGFAATGILPYNPNLFTEEHFLHHQQTAETQEPEQAIPTSQASFPGQLVISPKDIHPVPRLPLPSTSNSRAGSAAVVSSSPFKKNLQDSLERKQISKRKLSFKKTQPEKQKGKHDRKKRKPSTDSSSSSDEDDPPYVSTDDSDSTNHDDDDAQCGICEGLYSSDKHGETWLKCKKCFQWFHEKCDVRKTKKQKFFTCPDCS